MLTILLFVLLGVCSSQSKPFFNDTKAYGPYLDPGSIVKTINVASSDPAHQEEDGVKMWRFNIAAEGCGSARLQLKPFDMAERDYVVVYGVDADGQQTGGERYEGKGWREEGEVNSRRVWAKELVLEMHNSSPHSHFLLNYVHYADCFHERPGIPESICGTKNWLDIACFWYYGLHRLGRSVFRIRFVKGGLARFCTGWKATDNSYFITNWHCLDTQAVISTAELDYKYDATFCGSGSGNAEAVYHGDRLIQASGSTTLDFTIFTVKEDTSDVACLRRTNSPPNPTTQYMMIIHHPFGELKKVSTLSDQDTSGMCRRASTCHETSDYCYTCDTADGSDGAPVSYFALTNEWYGRVFALNHAGGCPNSGVKMSLVAGAAGSNLPSCS